MDKQNIPVVPLLYRGVDVIIANDNSGDTSTNWPNGTSLYTTMQWAQTRGIAFPTVPSPTEIIAKGWTQKPMFYGCNATTGALIIYIPAAPGINGANGVVNIDTLTFTVDYDAVPTFISNGNANILRQSGTPAASSVPSNWAQCVACAVMDRQLKKAGTTRPAVCQTCFNSLCYS
jgi:lysophospholipase